ncbi:MAG: hypothetical protein K2W99_07155 [Chthoniobacterales bacterium]|nr:hypothetical protein [Chthoniobacterales bacterium]
MIPSDNFHYALENTRVIVPPSSFIETFGQTSFQFHLVTEPMDEVGAVRIRAGRISAERPRIMSPQHIEQFLLEGFGEKAHQFLEFLESHSEHFKILRYGFIFKKTDVSETLLQEPKEKVLYRLKEEIEQGEDRMVTLIEGIDDAWEACLIKFTMDLIQRSTQGNLAEWKKRGFI